VPFVKVLVLVGEMKGPRWWYGRPGGLEEEYHETISADSESV
jgi:hypothetical protein